MSCGGNPRTHLVVTINGSQFTVEFHLPLMASIGKGESEYATDTQGSGNDDDRCDFGIVSDP